MKKFILMAVMAVCVMGISAQKGTWYAGTSGFSPFQNSESYGDGGIILSPMTGFVSYDFKDSHSVTSFGLAPEVGYFVQDNIVVGLGAFFTSSKYSYDDSNQGDLKFNTFGLNPYARYYYVNSGNFKAYGQMNFAYASAKADYTGAKAMTSFTINVVPGISYNLSEKFAINATFGELAYTSFEDKNDNDKASAFGLVLNASTLKFGFTVSF